MISVQHLTKSYGTATAVDRLSFEVGPGEVLGLIGPNGAGKTSTLRCLAGIHRPTAGTVALNGHDIVRDPVAAKRVLAFVADEPHLFEHLTLVEHLRLMARIYGVADVESRVPAGCGSCGPTQPFEEGAAESAEKVRLGTSQGFMTGPRLRPNRSSSFRLAPLALIVPVGAAAAAWFLVDGSWAAFLIPSVVFSGILVLESAVASEVFGRILDRADLQDVAIVE